MKNVNNKVLVFILFEFNFLFIRCILLNNIIRIGESPFKYNHFSFINNGDLIIDSLPEQYSTEGKTRNFFGIAKNGRKFFSKNNGTKDYFLSMPIIYDDGRILGESYTIKVYSSDSNLNGKEYILGLSQALWRDYKTELYEISSLVNKSNIYFLSTNELLGLIASEHFSILEDPSSTESTNGVNYYVSFLIKVGKVYRFYTKKIYFYFNADVLDFGNLGVIEIKGYTNNIISCYFTASNCYICLGFFEKRILTILGYNPKNDIKKTTEVISFTNEPSEEIFYKGIYLKDEIGFFIFFEDKEDRPSFSIYRRKDDNQMEIVDSIEKERLTRSTYIINYKFNDIIKLNDNTLCYIASTSDKIGLNIIIFNIYYINDNDERIYINILYYLINIWEENNIKLFSELKIGLYNNFLFMLFTHCYQEICDEPQENNYFSSLIFFGYPYSSNKNLNIEEYIYLENKNIENDIIINFDESYEITNNIFNYILNGTKIIAYPKDIFNLIQNDTIINSGDILEKGSSVQLKFNSNDFYIKGEYIIEYAYAVTESNYEASNDYLIYTDTNLGDDEISNLGKMYFKKYEYIGKSSDFIIIIPSNFTTNCNNDNCALCYEKDNSKCIICKYDFEIDTSNNKTCFDNPANVAKTTQVLIVTQKIVKEDIKEDKYNIDEILTRQSNSNLTSEQISYTTEKLSDRVNYFNNSDYAPGELNQKIYDVIINSILFNYEEIKEQEIIIKSESDFVYHISTSDNIIKESNNESVQLSKIDLGKCEDELREKNEIKENSSLIIISLEKMTNISSDRNLQFELYESFNKTRLDLSICKDIPIIVNIPLVISNELNNTYNELKDLGYNLFDINDNFYQDICTPYKSHNNTDILLSDRINDFYYSDEIRCQPGCTFSNYSIEKKNLKCNCHFEKSEINLKAGKYEGYKSLYKSYYEVIKYSNYKVLTCYSLAFRSKNFIKNYGSIMSLLYFIIYLISFIIFFIKGTKDIKKEISQFLIEKKSSEIKNDTIFINPSSKNMKDKQCSKQLTKMKKDELSKQLNSDIIENDSKNNKKLEIKTIENGNMVKFKTNAINKNIADKTKKNDSRNYLKLSLNFSKEMKPGSKLILKKGKKQKFKNLDNFELNNLDYKKALNLDKRKFKQVYFSLIKREHLIIFTFFSNNDHNIFLVKLSRFFFLMCTDMALNVFFFFDETMHKIYLDYGKYKFIQQIPQIIYSMLASQLIQIFLCFLSLTDKSYYRIKNLYNKNRRLIFPIIRCAKIKIYIFYIFTFIMFIFYWYTITCFCAVYENTQIIFIKDSLSSFAFGLVYPFILYYFSTILRIISLKFGHGKLVFIYMISDLIPIF